MFGRGRCRLCCFLRLLFGHLCNDQTNVVVAELLQHMLARCRFVFVVGELPLLGKAKPAVFGQVRMERLEILVDWSFFFFFFFQCLAFCCCLSCHYYPKPCPLSSMHRGASALVPRDPSQYKRQGCRDNWQVMVSAIDSELTVRPRQTLRQWGTRKLTFGRSQLVEILHLR